MWSLRTEDFELDPPAVATAARARVYKFFRSDLFEGLKTAPSTRRSRRGGPCCLTPECQTAFSRSVNLSWFLCGCMGSLAQQMAPWLLAILDATTHLALYFSLIPNTLLVHLIFSGPFHYSFRRNLEDVVAVGLARAVAVSLTACMGFDRFQRPYLFAAGGCALIGIPFLITKAAIFKYHGRWWWAVTMFVLSLVFSLAHVFCSIRVVELARRRFSQGMLGFSVRAWEVSPAPSFTVACIAWQHLVAKLKSGWSGQEGEEAWLTATAAARPSPLADSEWGWQHAWQGDVAPEALADPDSRFLKLDGVTVHYKVAEPEGGGGMRQTGVLLVHGFGGGVFAWRHVMQPLADHTGCRVVAFDRPAFGLTSRPSRPSAELNPYESKSQARLLLQLCAALQLRRVVLVGHADGALVCLLAAAARSSHRDGQSSSGAGAAAVEEGMTSSREAEECVTMDGDPSCSSPVASSSCLGTLRSSLVGTQRQRGGGGSGSAKAALSTPQLRPSRSADLSDAEAAQGSGDGGEIAPEAASGSGGAGGGGGAGQPLLQGLHSISVVGIALLHPSLEGESKPQFMRLLGNTKLGRRIMRPLLRTEIGEIANRRSWFNEEKFTREVLDLYKRPLCVQGWDKALMKVSKLKTEVSTTELLQLFFDVADLPSLVIGGQQDSILPCRKVEAIHEHLPRSLLSLLPACGHLAHEECPRELLALLVPFVADAYSSRSLPSMAEELMMRTAI